MAKKKKEVKKPKNKIKKTLLAIAIALIFVFFINYGIFTFYDKPNIESFCKEIPYDVVVDSCPEGEQEKMIEAYPRITERCWCEERLVEGSTEEGKCYQTNPDYIGCQENYQEARKVHDNVYFIVLSVVGLLAVIVALLMLKENAVTSGILGGGILCIINGIISQWDNFNNVTRFVILGIILVILIVLGYKKLNK